MPNQRTTTIKELKLKKTSKAVRKTPDGPWYPLVTNAEDDIWFCEGTDAPSIPRQTVITLQTSSFVTWWKGLDIFDMKRNKVVRNLWTQDKKHGPETVDLVLNNFYSPKDFVLVFSKAKFLGIHTTMYYLPFEYVFNRHLIFEWVRDA